MLCMIVTSIEFHTFILVSVTLVKFEGHSGAGRVKLESVFLTSNFVRLSHVHKHALSNFSLYSRETIDTFPPQAQTLMLVFFWFR